jgi:hypothetical protein
MGASDLDVIKEILLKKDFSFAEAARTADDTEKEGSSAVDAVARGSEAVVKDHRYSSTERRGVDEMEKDASSSSTSTRSEDDSDKQMNEQSALARTSDGVGKEDNSLDAEARGSDATVKDGNTLDAEARNEDAVDKDEQRGLKGSERNQDFVSQHFHQDRVDWSGGRPPYELR